MGHAGARVPSDRSRDSAQLSLRRHVRRSGKRSGNEHFCLSERPSHFSKSALRADIVIGIPTLLARTARERRKTHRHHLAMAGWTVVRATGWLSREPKSSQQRCLHAGSSSQGSGTSRRQQERPPERAEAASCFGLQAGQGAAGEVLKNIHPMLFLRVFYEKGRKA